MAKASGKKSAPLKATASGAKTTRRVNNARRNNHYVLDDVDYALLDLLQEDASRNNVKLSHALKKKGYELKAASCGNRKEKLRKHGYIKRFAAVLDHGKLGRSQMCFFVVKMDNKTEQGVDTFLNAAKAEADITSIYEMSGICDFLMVGRVANMAGATDLAKKLRLGVADINSFAVGGIPKEPGVIKFSD